MRGLVIQDRAEGSKVVGETYVADAGVPMARAATETQKAGLSGPRVRAGDPGVGRWRRVGQRRRPRVRDGGRAAVGPRAPRRWHRGRAAGRPSWAWPTATADSSTREPDGPAELIVEATFGLEPADADTIKARLDDIRHWRQAHQPLGLPSAGSVFRNPPGDSAGRLIDAAGLKGRRIGGAVVSEKHANFIVNDQKGTATDVRRLVDLVHAEILARDGMDLEPEVQFVGDWSGWEVAG